MACSHCGQGSLALTAAIVDSDLCLKTGGPITLARLPANVYYKSCLHHIMPYARETESARYLPRCSLELLETTGNAVICLE